MPIDELAQAVRDKRVSPLELVVESLRRIEERDGELNAVIALRADQALEDAANSPCTGPLAGLPLLVKDLADVGGMRTTLGSHLHADRANASADDAVIARLRAAGAIVVGKTNTPAYGHTAVTTNPVFGPTRNPWNTAKSPGGSSGGSAAALAAGLAPLATSTDGGGSVRIPASLCGMVGYKPTIGAVGRTGAPRWMTFSTNGCTNSSVADVVSEAQVIFGPTMGDLCTLPPGAISLDPAQPVRALACRTLRADVDAPIAEAFDAALAAIVDEIGVPVDVIDSPFPEGSLTTWFLIAAAELAQSLAPYRDRWDEFEPSLLLMLEIGEGVTASEYISRQRELYEWCQTLDELLGDDAVLLTPTVNALAWPAEGPMPARAGSTDDPSIAVNTPEFNGTGHPGVSVPMGIGPDGVPLGLQIIGPRWRDGHALGLAAAFEAARPWPQVALGYEPFGTDLLT
ncbi:MAG: amidase [Actinobacteria bacterium]|nr:amidase [Actinomycetota bacterium]